MNTILEWALVALFVVGTLCALALVGIWLWSRRDEKLIAEIRAIKPVGVAEAEAERQCWASFKARMAQEEKENKLGRFLGVNRTLLKVLALLFTVGASAETYTATVKDPFSGQTIAKFTNCVAVTRCKEGANDGSCTLIRYAVSGKTNDFHAWLTLVTVVTNKP